MNQSEAKQLAEDLMVEHKLGKAWKFEWIKKSWSINGRCNKRKHLIELSTHFVDVNPEEEVRNTILHEIAHAKCHKTGHSKYWKAWCIKLGARPIRINTICVMADRYENKKVCCICNLSYEGLGHNPYPLKESGRCCDKCNEKVVMERIRNLRKV